MMLLQELKYISRVLLGTTAESPAYQKSVPKKYV